MNRFSYEVRALWVVALISVMGAIPVAHGATPIYVDNRAGSDSYNGQTPVHVGPKLGPVRSVQTALRRVSRGGTIIILPTSVPYEESFTIDAKQSLGTAKYPLVIEGNGVESRRLSIDCSRKLAT